MSCSKAENAEAEELQKQLFTLAYRPLERAKGVEKQVLECAEQQKKQAAGL